MEGKHDRKSRSKALVCNEDQKLRELDRGVKRQDLSSDPREMMAEGKQTAEY